MKSMFKRIAHILYVNDRKEDVACFSQAMEAWSTPHEVKVVEDVDEAIHLLSSGEDGGIDIVIVDVEVGNNRGMDVIRKVRENEMLQCIPVIVMSSKATDEEVYAAYNLYANCFIQTPKDLAEMKRVLTSIEQFWFHVAFLPGFRKLQKNF